MSGAAALAAPAEEAPVEIDAETRARAMGWKPLAEFRGDPKMWRDADEFIRHGETELPILRERHRAAERKIADLERTVLESTAVVQDLTTRFRTADERAYKRAKAELIAQRDQAIEVGDKAAVHRLDADMRELDQTAPPPPRQAAPVQQQAAPAVHPDVMAWHQRNPWFQRDPAATAEAERIHMALQQAEPGLSVAENLERVTQAVRALYPDRVGAAPAARQAAPAPENTRRNDPPEVTGSSPSRSTKPNPRGFDAIPAESRAAYTRYSKQLEGKGKPLTKDEWAADYWSQFEEG